MGQINWDKFVATYHNIFISFAISHGVHKKNAEDIVHNVYCKMLEKSNLIEETLKTYFMTSIKNGVYNHKDYWNRKGRDRVHPLSYGMQSAIVGNHYPGESLIWDIIKRNLTDLEFLVLSKHGEGYPLNEIAEIAGTTKGSVSATLTTSRKKIRKLHLDI